MVQKKNGSMMLNVQSQNVATPLVYRMSGSTPIKSITLGQGKGWNSKTLYHNAISKKLQLQNTRFPECVVYPQTLHVLVITKCHIIK